MSRDEVIKLLKMIKSTVCLGNRKFFDALEFAISYLRQPEQRWIPFKTRSLTEEEKEEHPEWDCILDCILPDNGQAILVSIDLKGHERVQYDEFYNDDGSYLDSGYEIGSEATAWMPLPEPYRMEETE